MSSDNTVAKTGLRMDVSASCIQTSEARVVTSDWLASVFFGFGDGFVCGLVCRFISRFVPRFGSVGRACTLRF
jgi:hypothetical protein